MKNLFGEEDDMKIIPANQSEYQKFRRRNNYHKSKDERQCGNCTSSFVKGHHNKRYWKCKLIGCSCAGATDIRKSYVCDKWREGNEEK